MSVQGRLKKPVRPELLSFKGEKLDQALAGAIDAALDRSNRHVADAGGLIVGEPLRPDQEKRLALVVRQLRQSDAEVGPIKLGALLRQDGDLLGQGGVRVLDLSRLRLR